MMRFSRTFFISALAFLCGTAIAQAAEHPFLDSAAVNKVVQQAKLEIERAHLTGCIAVVDEAGSLLFLERLDNAPAGCVDASIGKARTSALYHSPTVKFMQRLAGGETTVLEIPNAVALGGGFPLTLSGTVAGAVGISTPKQDLDNQASEAAAQAIE
jgi:glc operon protein GlcG